MYYSTRISAGLGAAGAVAMIATVAWTVQALAPAMGGAGPMLGTATLVAASAAAVGGLSLLGLRRPSRIWILQAVAGALVALLATGQYHLSALNWLLLGVGAAWLAAGGFGLTARLRSRRPTQSHPTAKEPAVSG
jgi:hypothetical protein